MHETSKNNISANRALYTFLQTLKKEGYLSLGDLDKELGCLVYGNILCRSEDPSKLRFFWGFGPLLFMTRWAISLFYFWA